MEKMGKKNTLKGGLSYHLSIDRMICKSCSVDTFKISKVLQRFYHMCTNFATPLLIGLQQIRVVASLEICIFCVVTVLSFPYEKKKKKKKKKKKNKQKKKDRKSTRLNSSHEIPSRMPSSA
eukprot:TRINITY_DN7429_c0_g1_i1.p6 TRINITY_DN7429_c0_g1~~TRINITY_DN7429_c0_g1_i1.p6  ORF type:complete len:121 (-),score=15.49 TRINITY_DN7429_c0_g1_i1:5-367(-)